MVVSVDSLDQASLTLLLSFYSHLHLLLSLVTLLIDWLLGSCITCFHNFCNTFEERENNKNTVAIV